MVLTDSTTANNIICNNCEPTTVNTDMIIKANTVLFGDTLTHTSLSGTSPSFYTKAIFINIYGLRTDSNQDTRMMLDCSLRPSQSVKL
ncbi:MAG: hypothetical protein ACKPKO_45340, partial [Candidatus Fonsibacter sp.]